MMCNEQGGVVDDLLVYRLGERRFMLVVNAGTQNSDETWIRRHLSAGTVFENISGQTAKIDVQGPAAPQAMQRLMDEDIAGMRYYTFGYNRYGAKRVLISRTGYTGEIGFEVYGEAVLLRRLWDACLNTGAVPAGLGARDTLRLEAGLPLYGHELCPGRNAAESGFTKAIAEDKEFVGSEAIRNPAPGRTALVGIALDGRRAARAGDPVYDAEGRQAGIVTSGSFAPSLGRAVALGYVKEACRLPGYRIVVRTEKQTLAGQVTSTPFYRGTAGKPIGQFLDGAIEGDHT